MHSRQVRGKEFRSRQHRVVRGRRKDEIDHIPRVAHALNLGGATGSRQASWTTWARWRQGNSTGLMDRRGGSEFLALHLSGDTRIDHHARRCVARSSFLLNQGRDFMKFALPVFSAFVVSATLAVAPAQTSAEDRAVLSPTATGRTGRGRSARPDRLPDIGKVNCLRLGDSWAPVTLFTHPELAGERCSQDRRKLF